MGLVRREFPKVYEYEGRKYSIQELADMAGCGLSCMQSRLHKMTVSEAVERGPATHESLVFEYNGRLVTVTQLARMAKVSYQAMAYRLRHYPPEVCLAMKHPEKGMQKMCSSTEKFEYRGKMYTVNELAKIAGCTGKEMDIRLDFYHTVEDAVRGAVSLSV